MPFEDAETLRKQKNSNEDIEQINIFVLNQDQFLLLLYHRFMEILKKIKMCSFPVNISLKTHAHTKMIKAPSMGFHRCQMAKKN